MSLILGDPLVLMLLLIIVVAVLYYYRSDLSLRLRVRPYEGSKSTEGKRPTRTATAKECPSCGNTMDEGYLIGPQGIYWSKSAPMYALFGRGLGVPGAEPMGFSSLLRRDMRTQHFKAYRCHRCGIVHVELNEQQPWGL